MWLGRGIGPAAWILWVGDGGGLRLCARGYECGGIVLHQGLDTLKHLLNNINFNSIPLHIFRRLLSTPTEKYK